MSVLLSRELSLELFHAVSQATWMYISTNEGAWDFLTGANLGQF